MVLLRQKGTTTKVSEWLGNDGLALVRLDDSWDPVEAVHKIAMLRWDTTLMTWVKFAGTSSGIAANVTVLNWPTVQVDQASGGTDEGFIAMVVVDQVLSTLGVSNDGDYERLRVTGRGALWVKGDTTDVTVPAEGSLAGSALTASYQTVLDPSGDAKLIWLRNTCNLAIRISLDGGTTLHATLEPRENQVLIDLAPANLHNSGIISARHDGATPTAGSIRATVFK